VNFFQGNSRAMDVAIDRCGGRYDEEQSEVSLMIMR
jgi:hypothetical protein